MTAQTIQQYFDSFDSPVQALRARPFWDFTDSEIFKMEASNWRAEQNAWFETVAEAQRRAQKRLPPSVYKALVAGSEKGWVRVRVPAKMYLP